MSRSSLVCETTDYDKLWSDFLASDKSEEYKKVITSLLETDYRRFTYCGKKISENLALELSEIEFKKFKIKELQELAKNLRVNNFSKLSKQELIEKIESIRKQFCK